MFAHSDYCLSAYYRGAMGILLVYDVTDDKSFASIQTVCQAVVSSPVLDIKNWIRNTNPLPNPWAPSSGTKIITVVLKVFQVQQTLVVQALLQLPRQILPPQIQVEAQPKSRPIL